MKFQYSGAEYLSYILLDVGRVRRMREAGSWGLSPLGDGQPRRLSLRGLSLNPAIYQGYDHPHQQERKEARQAVEAHQLAQIEGRVSATSFGGQQHGLAIRG